MSYQNIQLETVEPGINCLAVNRPKSLNALNADTLAEIGDAIKRVGADTSIRVLLITGAGDKAFVAGADISAMVDMSPLQAQSWSTQAMQVFRSIEALPIPVIAVVNGYALGGGCELAMSCDWAIASENAVFGQPEVNLGVIAGFGGTQRLTRLVGRGMAMEMLCTGRMVKAEEAQVIGLVNHVYPAANLMDEALKTARTISAKAQLAVNFSKQAVQRGQDQNLENACVLETQLFGLCFSSPDQTEGMQAFLEKRTAKFGSG